MPVIYIKDLIIKAKHGVHQREKNLPQRFKVNLEVTVKTLDATASDELKDTINWSNLRDIVVTTVENNSFNLVERLAQEAADKILLSNQHIDKLTISIDKLDAFKTGVPGVTLELKGEA